MAIINSIKRYANDTDEDVADYLQRAKDQGKRVEILDEPKKSRSFPSEPPTVAYTYQYEGACLVAGEMNYRDDSDFYVVVWDGAKLKQVMYDTTRFAGGGHATIDATDEVKAAADDFLEDWMFQILKGSDKEKAKTPAKGDRVKVYKGRKVPVGTEGTLFWIGTPQTYGGYSRWSQTTTVKCGIALSDEKETVTKTKRNGEKYTVEGYKDVAWTYLGNLEVLNWEDKLTSDEDLRKKAKGIRGNYRAQSMYASARAGMIAA